MKQEDRKEQDTQSWDIFGCGFEDGLDMLSFMLAEIAFAGFAKDKADTAQVIDHLRIQYEGNRRDLAFYLLGKASQQHEMNPKNSMIQMAFDTQTRTEFSALKGLQRNLRNKLKEKYADDPEENV